MKKLVQILSHKATRWTLALLLAGTSVLLALALLTFDPRDPSPFFQSTTAGACHNLLGLWGASLAAHCFFMLGLAAFGLPLVGLLSAALLAGLLAWEREWERLAALCVGIPTYAMLMAVYGSPVRAGVTSGGWLGIKLLQVARAAADELLVIGGLHVFMVVCLVLATRLFFLPMVRPAGKLLGMLLWSVWHALGYISQAAIHAASWCMSGVRAIFHQLRGIYGEDVTAAPVSLFDFERAHLSPEVHDFDERSLWEDGAETAGDEDQQIDASALHAAMDLPTGHPVPSRAPSRVPPPAAVQPQVAAKQPAARQRLLYRLPGMQLFERFRKPRVDDAAVRQELEERARTLEEKLERFGVKGRVTKIEPGPVITLFEYQPNIDTKISKIIALEDDLALALRALSIRIIAPIPGTSVVGFEVANQDRHVVYLSDILEGAVFKKNAGYLPLILGEDTSGRHVVVDLAKMPHLLIAGSTGSGKSVALNGMLVSLLCARRPDEVQLILIDPKRLEFAGYADIGHLIFPIVTDPKLAAPVLRWVVKKMEERYEHMAAWGVRNIFDYKKAAEAKGHQDDMPFIVVVIDELADLMMTAAKEVEDLIARIAQMARAAGIHLILATQRPSVDVITGLIKVNFPSRISFRVTSKIDSRTILDSTGAEKLLGKGDMLFMDSQGVFMRRVHGAYVSDGEIEALVGYIRQQAPVHYLDLAEEIEAASKEQESPLLAGDEKLYDDVVAFLATVEEISISMLQRKFRIGFNRSARIIDMLAAEGRIAPAEGGKTRRVIR